jgi:hypothetical protein
LFDDRLIRMQASLFAAATKAERKRKAYRMRLDPFVSSER